MLPPYAVCPPVPEMGLDLTSKSRSLLQILYPRRAFKVHLPDGPTAVKVFQTPEGVRPVLGSLVQEWFHDLDFDFRLRG